MKNPRIGRILRRLVLVLALVVGAHWLAVNALTTYDGWRIARFKEASGAPDLQTYLRGRVDYSWVDNGWGHCVAALSCLTDEMTDAALERRLDAAHRALETARAAPRVRIVLQARDVIGYLPEIYALHAFGIAAVRSARTALGTGDVARAEQRLDDAWFLCEHIASPPGLASVIYRDTIEAMLCVVVAEHLDRWSPAFLRACAERLAWDWRGTLDDALRGDVYNLLGWWKREGGAPSGFSFTGLATAYDRHSQLGDVLDAIDDPFAPPAGPRTAWQRAILGPRVPGWPAHSAKERAASRAVVREGIRLECARRETGTIPAPAQAVDGFTITSARTKDGVKLTTPDSRQPAKVVVKP